jgi:exopolysaccharide biosynthesis polyprenyl glycosylphosphotransferase
MNVAFPAGERILILGATSFSDQLVREVASRPRARTVIVGVLDDVRPESGTPTDRLYLGPLSRLQNAVEALRPHRIVTTVSAWGSTAPLQVLFDTYVSRGVIVEEAHEFYERLTGKIPLESLTAVRVMTSGRFRPTKLHALFARALSLVTAAVALVLLAPILAVIALAIKLDSPGPVFFAQRRVGMHGRPFTLLKFRTMRDEHRRRSEWAGDNLDRVTRLGRWLRRFRLDELPQFINILRGEMNLVGPRPHPLSNLELFTLVARNLNELTGEAISCYTLRLVVRPGLTGWAQVRYRYANNLDEEIEKLRYDLYYVKRMSPWLDLRVLVETLRVFGGRVAEDAASVAQAAPRPAATAKPALAARGSGAALPEGPGLGRSARSAASQSVR